MAMKLGAENKRNVIIAGILVAILIGLGISQLTGGPSTPPPATTTARTPVLNPAPAVRTAAPGASASRSNGTEARKLPSSNLDPALHLEKLASSESIEYAGNGRNIFSPDSAPIVAEQPLAPARPDANLPVADAGPPPPPQPPSIDMKYFGYAAANGGERKAFLLHGEDIFEASAGEIVDHRFKIVAVQASSVQITDLSYNNTQTLPLSAN
jgi:hypothetical protein